MKTSIRWVQHFKNNLTKERVNWELAPCLSNVELNTILPSLQAWQLGETSDGSHLLKATTQYAEKTQDLSAIEAVRLFIKEEQKHGNNLGKYLDLINKPRIRKNWGDSLFRTIRYYNSSMELWTLS